MRFLRYPALMGVLLLLSGCAQGFSGFSLFDRSCVAPGSKKTSETLAGIDWDTARVINLRIRQDTFTPTYIGLVQGGAYRLMIENADDDSHVFRARDFFRSIVVSDVRVISGPGAGMDKGYACSGSISVAAGGITEARFVAARDGVYEFDNNSGFLPFVMTGSAGGFIIVERKRIIPESPVKHLKILERTPLVTAPVVAPTGGLFDDEPAPQQPIEATPSVPVEATPVEELPVEELPQKDTPAAKLSPALPSAVPAIDDTQLNKAPAADLFSD